MTDPMQEIRASFFVECEELLEALQDGLQTMSDGSAETETINVVFRAVHSIKGGAGAFGLDELVRFAHKFENALDAVRAGELTVDDALVSFFYRCGDILSDLVRSARDEETLDPATIEPVLEELLKLTGDEGDEVEDTIEFTPTALSLDLDGVDGLAGAGDDMWDLALPGDLPALDAVSSTDSDASHGKPIDETNETTFRIVFSPEPELYSGGNEPLFLFRLLADLGELTASVEAGSTLPALDELRVNVALLTWTMTLRAQVDRAAVAEIFEFVEGLCQLEITDTSDDIPVPQAVARTPVADSVPAVAPAETPCAPGEFPIDSDPEDSAPPAAEGPPHRRRAWPRNLRRFGSTSSGSTDWSTWSANSSSTRRCWPSR